MRVQIGYENSLPGKEKKSKRKEGKERGIGSTRNEKDKKKGCHYIQRSEVGKKKTKKKEKSKWEKGNEDVQVGCQILPAAPILAINDFRRERKHTRGHYGWVDR